MARLRPKHVIQVDLPLAAMSDVSFLLIIFFIVTSSFSRPSKLPVELPGEKTAAAMAQKPVAPPSVRVASSRVYLNDQPVELWQVTSDLRAILVDKPQPADRVVILRSDGGVPMERVVEVMDAIRSAEAHVGFLELDAQR
jgi:biopolymer transport protein ExbD